MKDFSELEKKIGLSFKNQDLLRQAFTHRSYLNENHKWNLGHNERLEFLGDAVLELSVSDYLYKNKPNQSEGHLTSLRAALVNSVMLAEVGDELDFDQFLLLSKGEGRDLGRGRKYILANTFESLVGAIYLDQGYETADKFITSHLIEKKLDDIIKGKTFKDAKSLFQEKAQAEYNITPVYKIIKEWGPDHDKQFRSGVFLGEEIVAEGEGLSKQEAEVEAAKKGLEVKGW